MDLSLSDRLFRFKQRVEAMFPPIGHFVSIAGCRVHYVRSGEPSGVPVVLIHGASGNVRDWQLSILRRLAETHDVIAFDRPGFGYSDALPDRGWKLTDQIAHLRQALATLGVSRFILVGHSYGGTLVMRWVLQHPDEVAGVLALSAPVLDWGGGGLGIHYEIGGRPVIGPALAWVAPLLAGPDWLKSAMTDVFAPDPVPPAYFTEGGVELALRPHTFRANSVMMFKIYSEILDQYRRYPEITCPVEIVHGEADIIVPPQIHAIPLSNILPDARLTLLPGVGHMPHHARPNDVVAALDRLAAAAR